MYVIVVNFLIYPQHVAEFKKAVLEQAQNSFQLEESCVQFDVCVDPENERSFLLYEIYRDEAAFQKHTETDHFKRFFSTVETWIESKNIKNWKQLHTI